jgi:hypothetical protein
MLTFLEDVLSENNYRLFSGLVLDVLLKPWEKYVMSMKYTEVSVQHSIPKLPYRVVFASLVLFDLIVT